MDKNIIGPGFPEIQKPSFKSIPSSSKKMEAELGIGEDISFQKVLDKELKGIDSALSKQEYQEIQQLNSLIEQAMEDYESTLSEKPSLKNWGLYI
ncbi:hypothetical protein ACFL96_06860 [Thermoproteota archaeon]